MKLFFSFIVLSTSALGVLPITCEQALDTLNRNAFQQELKNYATIESLALDVKTSKQIEHYQSQTGFSNIKRDSSGNVTQAKFRILIDNPNAEVTLLGPFNHWGADANTKDFLLTSHDGGIYYEGTLSGLKHGMEYRVVLKNKQTGEVKSLLDPTATTQTTPEFSEKVHGSASPPFLNSIFWDHERPGAYRMKHPSVDLRGKYLDILEAEIGALVNKYKGGPKTRVETYRFIAQSGIVDEIKKMGYNAIEFLPFNPSVDGNTWHFRYQVFDLFGPNSMYGTPDEFKMMVDAFNKAGIAVIMDDVIGHYPQSGNSGIRDLAPIGIHQFKKTDGRNLFGQDYSPWGTFRYDYANPYVRQFLIDGVMTHLKEYGISGVRIDNFDGVKGANGGYQFMQDYVRAIKEHRPETQLIAEMFFGDNSVMRAQSHGGMGMGYRNHSDFFDFVKDYMQKQTEEINMDRVRNAIRDPWAWGELMRVSYITNHDEAANRRDGATGAYPATLLKSDDSSWYYVERKTKAFGSLAKLSGAASLDLPQMRLLQEGSFYSNPDIDWSLVQYNSQKTNNDYFSHLSKTIQEQPAFTPQNLHPNIENHTDYMNKVISLERIDFKTGKKVYAVINLGHYALPNYRFGISTNGRFKVTVDSDRADFGKSAPTIQADTQGEHGKSNSLVLPVLAPYQVLVFEEQ